MQSAYIRAIAVLWPSHKNTLRIHSLTFQDTSESSGARPANRNAAWLLTAISTTSCRTWQVTAFPTCLLLVSFLRLIPRQQLVTGAGDGRQGKQEASGYCWLAATPRRHRLSSERWALCCNGWTLEEIPFESGLRLVRAGKEEHVWWQNTPVNLWSVCRNEMREVLTWVCAGRRDGG